MDRFEAAAYLGMSPHTVFNMIRRGDLPGTLEPREHHGRYRGGKGLWLVRRADLATYLLERLGADARTDLAQLLTASAAA